MPLNFSSQSIGPLGPEIIRRPRKGVIYGPASYARAFCDGTTGKRRVHISGLLLSGWVTRSGHNGICASSPHQVIDLFWPDPIQVLKKLVSPVVPSFAARASRLESCLHILPTEQKWCQLVKRRRALLESNSPRNSRLRLIETVRVCAERHPFRADKTAPDDRSLMPRKTHGNSWCPLKLS
jgi:hypothetical protein